MTGPSRTNSLLRPCTTTAVWINFTQDRRLTSNHWHASSSTTPISGRQEQMPSLSCIWEILNAGYRDFKFSFKILTAESYLLCMPIKWNWTWHKAYNWVANWGASNLVGHGPQRPPQNPHCSPQQQFMFSALTVTAYLVLFPVRVRTTPKNPTRFAFYSSIKNTFCAPSPEALCLP